ncbi:transcription antitermination factor NusB [Actinopolymorpha sp. B17G11]|uniref:transcription antitermination factor NusB n=1 Tax=unclassified Actinopolymorpha TaxID=2627063 RepID=UPI0032D972FF
MSARTKARQRALEVLYEAELRDRSRLSTLADRRDAADPPISDYTVRLVEGVETHAERLDELLGEHAKGWSLARMAPVDRNILRLGAYELLYADDVPDPVAISEAVRMARELSGEEAPAFVNGLLARLLELKPTLLT